MILIHDLGEIDVGDIAFPNEEQAKKKHIGELNCVNRIHNILEEKWMIELLWTEFEEKKDTRSNVCI